ncbi:four helix bundle protein [Candidatus Gracilibacteria bacterium]|nr:four helix bundle protein [Candidatus Gracilibacteria bacterium]MCF7856212.1 four helix bundle protein [Candidatus Gracilibacteria bacterium]MCF7896484.1 four helix bundle protein [Candidatus Gracilibacteria bacterium]
MQYDLEERTKKFAVAVIRVVKKIKMNYLNENIIRQLLRCATSVAANYREANAASSKKDFRNKIFISRKEIQETELWIELLAETNPEAKTVLQKLWKEAHELTLIFNKISTSLKNGEISKFKNCLKIRN